MIVVGPMVSAPAAALLARLTVDVTPDTAAVHVTGPGGYDQSGTGDGVYPDLVAGTYTVRATSGSYVASRTLTLNRGDNQTVFLAPRAGSFKWYVGDQRATGESITLSIDGVSGSTRSFTTTPGYTQTFGNFNLEYGQTYTATLTSPTLNVTQSFTAQQGTGGLGNIVGVDIRPDSVSIG